MDFNWGNFGKTDHCGKETRKYLFLMAGLAVFVLLATYVYEFHYLPGKIRQQAVVAVNQPQTQAAQFASAPSGMGLNVLGPALVQTQPQNQNQPQLNRVAAPLPPPIPHTAQPPANHQQDGRAQMVCSSCHQVLGANAPGAAGPSLPVAFQNNPSMMLPVDRPPPKPHFHDVVLAVKASMVSITASQTRAISQLPIAAAAGPQFANPSSGSSSERIGSGVLLSTNGYLVTNLHVVKDSTGLMVSVLTNIGAKAYRAQIIKQDKALDLALLKIDPEQPTQPAPLGDSSKLQVADSVITLGSPFGLEMSVSRGIVAGLRQAIAIDGVVHDQLIQTDAAINQGNSGGAMLNRDGEVIGINTAIYTPTGAFAGIGFAIPINQVKLFIQDQVKLSDMAPGQGNAMQQLAPLPVMGAGALGAGQKSTLNPMQAPMQTIAAPQGPPIRANAMPPASHSDGRDRMACATCHPIQPGRPNTPLAMSSQPQTQPQPRPLAQSPMGQPVVAVQNNQLYLDGAVLEPLNDLLVTRINAQVSDGAFVATVYPDTAAARAGLQAGDIIFKINGRWVLTPDELLQRVSDYTLGDTLRLGVYRGNERLNLSLVLSGQLQQAGQSVPLETTQPARLTNELRWLGMELKPISAELIAKKPELQGKKGALVGDLDPQSLAEGFGLQKGDIIRRINGIPVNDMLELERAINTARLSQGVLLLLERNGRAIYLTLKQ
jgi:S1-C subfamily serine protease